MNEVNQPYLVRNYWYPVARVEELKDSLLSKRLLGESIFFSKTDNGITAYSTPSAKGKICGTIPVPEHLEKLKVQEKYGLIWVFAGPDEMADNVRIPDLTEFDEIEWKVLSGAYYWSSAHYTTILENSMDPAHTTFVHQGFGSAKDPVIKDLKLTKGVNWGSASISSYPPDNWRQKLLYRRKNSAVTANYSFYMPNIFKLKVTADNFSIALVTVSTPRDWTETETFWFWFRKGSAIFKSELLDPLMLRRMDATFKEDEAVVRTIIPKAVPIIADRQIPLACDSLSIHFRKILKKALENDQIIFQTPEFLKTN